MTMPNDHEHAVCGEVRNLAAEAVNSLDWVDVYEATRKRVLRDATGSFYNEHLAREIAERVVAALTAEVERVRAETIEACAKVADNHATATDTPDDFTMGYEQGARRVAKHVRALAGGGV